MLDLNSELEFALQGICRDFTFFLKKIELALRDIFDSTRRADSNQPKNEFWCSISVKVRVPFG